MKLFADLCEYGFNICIIVMLIAQCFCLFDLPPMIAVLTILSVVLWLLAVGFGIRVELEEEANNDDHSDEE